MLFRFVATVFLLHQIGNSRTAPASEIDRHPIAPAIRILHQFPNLTSIENIAVRPNGKLLLTPLTSSSVYSLDPTSPAVANIIYTFPNANSLLGITEYEPDVFAVVAGPDGSNPSIPWVIWSVDFRNCVTGNNVPEVHKIATLPKALLVNGLTHLAPGSPWILAADSQLGVIWRINTKTGGHEIAISDPLLAPGTAFGITLGVNGIHISEHHLFFTNSLLEGGLFAKIPINLLTGAPLGNATIIARNGVCDDFAIDTKGNAWVTQNILNGVQLIKSDGSFSVVLGGINSTIFEGATSAAFGRTVKDRKTLYVSTNGGSGIPTPGTFRIGGSVVAVDVIRI
jgi:hypothetical protein